MIVIIVIHRLTKATIWYGSLLFRYMLGSFLPWIRVRCSFVSRSSSGLITRSLAHSFITPVTIWFLVSLPNHYHPSNHVWTDLRPQAQYRAGRQAGGVREPAAVRRSQGGAPLTRSLTHSHSIHYYSTLYFTPTVLYYSTAPLLIYATRKLLS